MPCWRVTYAQNSAEVLADTAKQAKRTARKLWRLRSDESIMVKATRVTC